MIAISSYRPFEDSPVIAAHQTDAKATWNAVFTKIIYFGAKHPALWSPETEFIPCEGKPRICSMAAVAACYPGWSCIINADIVVASKARLLEHQLIANRADCCFSFRIPIGGKFKVDYGIDFFTATQAVWNRVASVIPEKFTIGAILWDTWLCSWFMKNYPYSCFDVSPAKLFWHPIHGERNDQSMEITDPYLRNMRWTARALSI